MSNKRKRVEQVTKDALRWHTHDYDDDIKVYVRVQGRIVPLADIKPTDHPTDERGIVLECVEPACCSDGRCPKCDPGRL